MKYFVSKEDIQKALSDKTVILDTRTQDEFSGKTQKKGASKAGRIPGSIHIDWADAIHFDGDQRLKSKHELDSIYGSLHISKDTPIIVYCHSGVRSAHTTFVLTQLLGYTHVKNYDGSWTEWSYFDELPIEKDSLY
jgi:thiosulfate/3-mercaptopyruvate sulfurtransferase